MPESPYKNILVPVDGTKATPGVVDKAIQLAIVNNAHLDILNVAQINQITEGYATLSDLSEGKTYEIVTIVAQRLKDIQKRAEQAGVKSASIHVRFGNPKTVIARDFIRDHHNDLIVMGSSSLNRFERALIGSVTAYVIRLAPCDVVVVKHKH